MLSSFYRLETAAISTVAFNFKFFRTLPTLGRKWRWLFRSATDVQGRPPSWGPERGDAHLASRLEEGNWDDRDQRLGWARLRYQRHQIGLAASVQAFGKPATIVVLSLRRKLGESVT
jgi:hypothetical protein